MISMSVREEVGQRRIALAYVGLVAISGGGICLFPEFALWLLLIAFLAWASRLILLPAHRTGDIWLVAVFLATACVGYWVSYDKTIALQKLYLIIFAIFLFDAIRSQPKENLIWVSVAWFTLGVGVAIWFFLTHDFVALPRKIEAINYVGWWLMHVRPNTGWTYIHPNYVAGLSVLGAIFGLQVLWQVRRVWVSALILPGMALIAIAFGMATSRGALLALASVMGMWLGVRLFSLSRIKPVLSGEAVFPSLVLLYMFAIAALLYIGPATNGGNIPEYNYFGTGSRTELFARSLYLVADFPFTGGGLGAFPALYSQYILSIPHYNLPNTHNLFLDVFIEQGVFGGLAFFLLYLASLWRVALAVWKANTLHASFMLSAFVFVFVHGMVDDYLYHQYGTMLSLALLGMVAADRKPWALVTKRIVLFASVLVGLIALLNTNRIISAWYANLGAVQMARVELVGFPTGAWAGTELLPALETADATLHSSLEADPANRTANQRLGMIALLRRDFPQALEYLKSAHEADPAHRGVIKQLGFCYVWLGDLQAADELLRSIPEAENELGAYITYWNIQGLYDVSAYAADMAGRLRRDSAQP